MCFAKKEIFLNLTNDTFQNKMLLKIRQKLICLNSRKYHQYKQQVANEDDYHQRIHNNKSKKKQAVFLTIVTSSLGIATIVNSTFGKIFDNCVLED